MDGEVMPPRFDVRAMLQNPRAALAAGFVLGVIIGAAGFWLLNRPVQPQPLTEEERTAIQKELTENPAIPLSSEELDAIRKSLRGQ